MQVLRSYVVRIYRQEPDGIAGVVESVETGVSAPFRSAAELWSTVSCIVPARRSLPSNIGDREEGR